MKQRLTKTPKDRAHGPSQLEHMEMWVEGHTLREQGALHLLPVKKFKSKTKQNKTPTSC